MRKSSSFMCVLVVLLAGGAEAQRPLPSETISLFGLVAFGAQGVDAWANCQKFSDIYADGRELIEVMWGGAFTYQPNETKGYSLWWFEGGTAGNADGTLNPNDVAAASLIAGYTPPNTCGLSYFHKDFPGPESDSNFSECYPWHANACCQQETTATTTKLRNSYGPGYEWDRCGPLSHACESFFVMEACFYECEVNTGFYRKYTDDQYNFCCPGSNCNTGTYNATLNYTCTGNENQWQLHAMPIKASFADSWYRACAEDYFCGTGDYFSCATDYHSEQTRLAALAAERVANMTSALAGLAYIQSLQDWVIPVAVVGAILLLVLCGFTIFLICKEKSGEPVFKSLGDPVDKTNSVNSTVSKTSASLGRPGHPGGLKAV